MLIRTTKRPLITVAILGAAFATVMAIAAQPAPAAGSPLLPDLRMAKLTHIRLDTTTIPGHRLLRYTAEMVNTGAGPFEVHGSRPDTSTAHLAVQQWVYDGAGNVAQKIDIPESDTFIYWAGDGHNHFHIADLEDGTLTRVSNGNQVGSLAKHGFHLVDSLPFDTSLPGAPTSAVYAVCGGSSCKMKALNMYMGISVGWLDRYRWAVVGQYIDITGLANGRYVVRDEADAQHWFSEEDTTNNWASATIDIGTNSVTKISDNGGV
jgi:hypothetical protein